MVKKSEKYWGKRFESLELKDEKITSSFVAKAWEENDKAQAKIESQIESWYQRLAVNNEVSLADAKKLLSDRELKEFKWSVEEYIEKGKENAINKAWMKELENASARVHIDKLEAQKVLLQAEVEQLYLSKDKDLKEFLEKSYEDRHDGTIKEIQKGLNIDYEPYKIEPNTISKAVTKVWAADGKNFSDRIWEDKNKLVDFLHTNLTQNLIMGENSDKLVGKIAKEFNVKKHVAARLIYTERAAITEKANHDAFKKIGVKKYQIHAELDSETSEICKEMHEKIFSMSDFEMGVTAPVFHPNCRTTTIPYFEDAEAEEEVKEKEEERKEEEKPKEPEEESMAERRKRRLADRANKGRDTEEQKPKQAEFTPAKTVEEAREYAAKITGQKDFHVEEGIHVNTVNGVNEALTDVRNKYGEDILVKGIEKMSTQAKSKWQMALSHNKTIIMKGGNSPNYMSQLAKNAEKNFKTRWGATNDPKCVIYHEIGHGVWESMPPETQIKIANEYAKLRRETFEMAQEYKKEKHDASFSGKNLPEKTDADFFGERVSRYGLTDEKEFFAEMFTKVMNGDNDELTKTIDGLIQEGYKKNSLTKANKIVEKSEKNGIIESKEKSGYDIKSITDADMDFYNSGDFEKLAKEALAPITDKPEVVESFVNASREILEAKGKTALEAGTFVDLDNAEIISRNFDSKEPLALDISIDELKRIFLDDKYKNFIAIHNHPNNAFPTYDDLRVAYNRRLKQKYGVVICHDGTVYAYDTPNSYIKDRFGESDFLTIQDEHYNDFNKFAAEMHEAFAITIRRYKNEKK